MRIGFFSEPNFNALYRTIIPMSELERRGHSVLWPKQLGQDNSLSALASCDVVHCYRRTGCFAQLRELAGRGVAICFDNDDNYGAAHSSGATGPKLSEKRFHENISRLVTRMACFADVTTTPSRDLADIYRRAGAQRVHVIENHLDREMKGFAAQRPHEGVVIGWVAAPEHKPDRDRLDVEAALRELLEVHPHVRVLSIGLKLKLPGERYEHLKEVDFWKLLQTLGTVDIGIAPICDTPFNRSRSNSKLKEYSSAGGMWLASPVGPYLGLGKREGGELVPDGRWYEALDALIRDTRRRKRLAKRARRWALSQTIEKHADAWERAFSEAIELRLEDSA
jgi:hypothetical protein